MIRSNKKGLIMVLIGVAVMVALAVFSFTFRAALSYGCGVMIVLDGVLRLRHSAVGKDKWLTAAAGGFFGRMPVWVLGLILLILLQTGLVERFIVPN